MQYELDLGEEIRGVTCPVCGASLVRAEAGAWCDECEAFVSIVSIETLTDEFELDEARGTFADFADGWWDEDEDILTIAAEFDLDPDEVAVSFADFKKDQK